MLHKIMFSNTRGRRVFAWLCPRLVWTKSGDVGIDVRSPCSQKLTVIFRWVRNRIKRVVSVLQSGHRAHIAVKLLCDVSTFDVNIQQPNCLVKAIFAEKWHANKPFVLLFYMFSCLVGLCSTRICVKLSTHITWSSCARKKCDLHNLWCYR